MSIKFGLVCPEWAIPHYSQTTCTVHQDTDGTHLAICHTVQSIVYRGVTEEEVVNWIRGTDYESVMESDTYANC